MAKGPQLLKFPGKNEGFVVLGEKPLVAETPESLLDDDTTPIELTYSVFRPGADPEIRTATAVGPVVTILQTNCGNQAASAPWTFTATSATGGSLACAVFYGGKLVKSTSDYAEGDVARGTAVDCTSHPGM